MEDHQMLDDSNSEFLTMSYSANELNSRPRLLSNECTNMIISSENCQNMDVMTPLNDMLLGQTFIIETNEQSSFINSTQLITFQHINNTNEQIDNIQSIIPTSSSENPATQSVNFSNDHFHDIHSNLNKANIIKTTNVSNDLKEHLEVLNTTGVDITIGNYSDSTAIKILDDVAKSPIDPNGHFICDLCLCEFYNWKHYKRHKLEHLNDKPFKCLKCLESFNFNNNYLLHIASHLTKNLRCPQCKKEFKRIASFKCHLKIHTTEESITCSICNKIFDNQYRLDIHKENCMQENLIDPDRLIEVTTSVFLKTCKTCKLSLPTVSEYKLHIKEHKKFDSVLKKQYKCPIKIKQKYKKKNIVKKFKCDYCDWSFSKSILLHRHMRTHTGEKPFKCPHCSIFFTQQNSLNRHLLKHDGIRPFKCEFCEMNFSQKGHLINHIKRCHAVTKEATRIHKCSMCSCVYNSINALNKHLNVHHGLKTKKSNKIIQKFKESNVENNDTSDTINLIKDSSKLEKWLEEVAHELQNVDSTEERCNNLASAQSEFRLNVIENEQYETINQDLSQNPNFKTNNCTEVEHFTNSACIDGIYASKKKQNQSPIKYNKTIENQETLNQISNKVDKSILIAIKEVSNKVFSKKKSKTVSKTNSKLDLLKNTNVPLSNSKRIDGHIATGSTSQTTIKTDPKVFYLPNITKNIEDLNTNAAQKSQPKCKFCEKVFKKNADLERHERTHTGDKPYKCDKQGCNKAFATKSSLEYHTITHLGKMKRAVCPQCNGLFATTSSMKVHMRQHTGEKPFKCPVCGDAFRTSGHLHTHVVIHERKKKHK